MVRLNKTALKKVAGPLSKAEERRTRSRTTAKMIATSTRTAARRKRKVNRRFVLPAITKEERPVERFPELLLSHLFPSNCNSKILLRIFNSFFSTSQ